MMILIQKTHSMLSTEKDFKLVWGGGVYSISKPTYSHLETQKHLLRDFVTFFNNKKKKTL